MTDATLTLEMRRRIEELARLIRTQDNRATAWPIFMVQQSVRDYGIAEGYEEDSVWCDCEGEVDDPETLASLSSDDAGDDDDYRLVGYRDRWENVQPFLTEEGANEYIRINGHNLRKTRIYVEAAFRNAEWQFMRELILALAPSEEVSQ